MKRSIETSNGGVKFLSREERAKLALEKRQKQVQERQDTMQTARKQNESFRSAEPQERAEVNSAELQAIRERYMGGKKEQRKIRKMTDKKFVFDWV